MATVYVKWDATGANNGTSWTDAFTTVQAAYSASIAGDEIWVAAGTYKTAAVSSYFTPKTGVDLYGGFNGTETLLIERDWVTNTTILSGIYTGVSKSYHVIVSALDQTDYIIDGFTIRDGNANGYFGGGWDGTYGGGIYIRTTNPTTGEIHIRNCIIRNNLARNGGGIWIYSSTGTVPYVYIESCLFTENSTDTTYKENGGACWVEQSRCHILDCDFISNYAIGAGGAIQWSNTYSGEITRCTFTGNYAAGNGGACYFASGPVSGGITDCSFTGNYGRAGGAIFTNSTLTINRCTLSGNLANQNTTLRDGGAIRNGSSLTIINSTITGNNAVDRCGGIYSSSSMIIYNSTIAYNHSQTSAGGGIYRSLGTVTLNSCILSNNTYAAIPVLSDYEGAIAANADYCLFMSPAPLIAGAHNILETDPLLSALADNGGYTQTHLIDATSPAYQTGTNSQSLTTDQRGTGYPRTLGGLTDIGSFEAQYSYDVTITNGANGYTDPVGVESVTAGSDLSIDIYPDVGYEIDEITLDGVPEVITNPYVLSAVSSDHTVNVNFSKIEYTITPSAGAGGSVSPDVPTLIEYGDPFVLSITPSTGYEISEILLDGVAQTIANPYIILSVDSGHTVAVSFSLLELTVSVSNSVGGSTSPTGDYTVEYGDDLSIAITPSTGYELSEILVDSVSQPLANPFVLLNITDDTDVVINFAVITFTVTITGGAGGSVSPTGEASVNYGEDLVVSTTPDDLYKVSAIELDDVEQPITSPYILTDVLAAHTIDITFELIGDVDDGTNITPEVPEVIAPSADIDTRPQFPSINKYIRLVRKSHKHYMQVKGQAKFPPLPYWKLLHQGTPTAPVPIEPMRAPTKLVVEAFDYAVGEDVPLTEDLKLVDYPQPPDDTRVVPNETTIVSAFNEAEWSAMRFKAFILPAFVKYVHSAQLTKFGKVIKTDGELHVSRFILEHIALEPQSGDLFQWGGKLRMVTEAIEMYSYIGTSDYWTWLKIHYIDFTGDSSNLNLPGLPNVVVPEIPDEQ